MGLFNRLKSGFSATRANESLARANTGGSSALHPSESVIRKNYIDLLMKNRMWDFYDVKHRVAVSEVDPAGKKITKDWAKRATTKTFKFYSSHETDSSEVMEEHRKRWNELGCNAILRKIIKFMTRDGFALFHPHVKGSSDNIEELDYDVYGEYECPQKLWDRDEKNKIVSYRIQYTPRPRFLEGYRQGQWRGHDMGKFKQVNEPLLPKECLHFERGEENWGLGDSRLEAAWDPISKLREESHMNMIKTRLVPTMYLTEDDWDDNHTKAKEILTMIYNADMDSARVWYKDKLQDGTVSEYPKFTLESPAHRKMDEESKSIRMADYGNVNNEWARLCLATGHTIHYFMGNRAGAVVGSEADVDQDIAAEIEEFSLYENVIKKLVKYFADKGLMPQPDDNFVVKYWKDWEHIETANKREEMMENQPDKETEPGEVESKDIVDSDKGGYKDNEMIEAKKQSFFASLMAPKPLTVKNSNILRDLTSESKIKRLGKEVQWSMGSGTAQNIKNLIDNVKGNGHHKQHRVVTMNAEAFGNSIKEKHPLFYYGGDGVILEEYICAESWKANVGKTVPLGVYHDFWGDVDLPEWQVVGDAEIFAWDDAEGEDYVKLNYDFEKIDAVFELLNEYDWLSKKLQEDKTADISTAYYCDIEERWSESLDRNVRVQVNIDVRSISFVPRGNCPGEVCTIKQVKNANQIADFVKDCVSQGKDREECIALAYEKFK